MNIKNLQAELSALQAKQSDLETQLQAEYNKVYNDCKKLQDAIKDLDNSHELTSVDNDEYMHQCINFDFKDFAKERVYLQTYLREEHYIDVNFGTDTLSRAIGPCILIGKNDRTRGYYAYDQDAGKEIANTETLDVNDATELYPLIETYMEKTGYFPSVVLVDYYGHPVKYVNTQNKGAQVE